MRMDDFLTRTPISTGPEGWWPGPHRTDRRRHNSSRQLYRHRVNRQLTRTSRAAVAAVNEGQGQPLLVLVLAALVAVTRTADGLGLEEQNLGDPLAGIDLGRQRGCIGDLDCDLSAPLRLEGRNVHNYAATCICGFTDAHTKNVARDLQVLDRLGQGEAVGRDQAVVGVDIDERVLVEVLRIDDGAADVGEDLEVPADAYVVAVAGHAVGDDA